MDKNLELLKRSKSYMEMLSKGIDPISGESIPNDSILNNQRLSRCFSFVSDVLEQLILSGGITNLAGTETAAAQKINVVPFCLTLEQRQKVYIHDKPLDVSTFTRNINNTVNTGSMQKLKGTAFATWLMKKGFLEKDGNSRKPTSSGVAIGISIATKQTSQLLYTKDAQKFLLDNIDEIIAISNGDL